jgi:hypothetical protein
VSQLSAASQKIYDFENADDEFEESSGSGDDFDG